LTFPTMPVPMDQFGTTGIPEPSAAPYLNVIGRGQIPLRAIVASEIRRYNRVTTQRVFLYPLFSNISPTNGRDKTFHVFTVDSGLHDFTE
jgi:hypothetical protein